MHQKKQENIFINPTFSLFCYCFFCLYGTFFLSTWIHLLAFLMALSVSMFQQFRACIVRYFLFSIPTLVERVPPFVTLRFFEFLPLRLAICNAFSYLVYF